MCEIISVTNQKGGVGKTTTAFHLGCGLAQKGYEVLLVDFDRQGSLSTLFGIDRVDDELEYTISDLLDPILKCEYDKIPDYDEVTISKPHLDLLPANRKLSDTEQIMGITSVGREQALIRTLDPLRAFYDYIIIDCGPSLGQLIVNAFVASDSVLIPFEPKTLSLVGVDELCREIERINQYGYNKDLHIEGFLATLFENKSKSFHRSLEEIRSRYSDIKIFDTVIPRNNNIERAIKAKKPVFEYIKNDPAGKAYLAFVDEFLSI